MIQAQTSVAHSSIDCGAIPVAGSVARFQGASGVEEYHLMIRPTRSESAAAQLEWLSQAYGRAIDSLGLSRDRCVFRRFFCSDLTNQAEVLEEFQFSRMHDPDDPSLFRDFGYGRTSLCAPAPITADRWLSPRSKSRNCESACNNDPSEGIIGIEN